LTLSRNGKNKTNGDFDWRDAMIDAGITAGITATTTGLAMTSTGVIYTPQGQLTLLWTVIGEFLVFLGVKRGLREKKTQ
jgi:hypothetical protein